MNKNYIRIYKLVNYTRVRLITHNQSFSINDHLNVTSVRNTRGIYFLGIL